MPVTITIVGPVRVTDDATGGPLTDAKRIAKVAKLKYTEEKVSEYVGAEVGALGVKGGDIRLSTGDSGLTVTSVFKAPAPLTAEQLQALVDETTGQWSDGIGEGCFDEDAAKLRVKIDLCPDRSQVTVGVVDDGKPVRTKSPKRIANEKLLAGARQGDLEAVKAALAAGADMEAIDTKNKWTALCWSTCQASEGHEAVSLFLIAAGADVDAKRCKSTPIRSAVRQIVLGYKSSLAVVKALLAAGVDPNQTYARDRALTEARDHPELRSLLLAAGAIESDWVLRGLED
jgi:uncharacterized protein